MTTAVTDTCVIAYRLSCSTEPRPAAPRSRQERSWCDGSSTMTSEVRVGSRMCTASAWRQLARSRSAHRTRRCRRWLACSPPGRWRSRSCDLWPTTIQQSVRTRLVIKPRHRRRTSSNMMILLILFPKLLKFNSGQDSVRLWKKTSNNSRTKLRWRWTDRDGRDATFNEAPYRGPHNNVLLSRVVWCE